MTVYTFNGYGDGTDVGSVTGWTRRTGNSGSLITNADGRLDIVTISPTSLYTCDESAVDHEFEITWYGTGAGDYFPCCGRVTDINNLYGVRLTGSTIQLYKYVAGVPTQLGSSVTIIGRVAGDVMSIRCVGSTISAKYKGVEKISVTDTAHTSATKMGIFVRGATGADRFDAAQSTAIYNYNITSANGGNAIKNGSVFSAVTTGFSNIVSGTLGGKALTSVSYNAGTVTATAPAYLDGQTMYSPDSTNDLILSDGTNTATLAVPTAPPDTYTAVTVASPNTADPTYLSHHMTPTPVNGDKFISTITISADGGVYVADPVTVTVWHWKLSTTVLKEYLVTINEYGVDTVRELTSISITSAGLSSVGLTSVSL